MLLQDPDIESLSSFIGIDGQNMTINQGTILINLKPRHQRTRSALDIARYFNAKIFSFGILYLQPVQDLTLDANVTATQYQFVLENIDSVSVKKWTPKLVAALEKSHIVKDVISDQQANGLVAFISLDRAMGARYSITPQTVDSALHNAFGQRQISTIYAQTNQYRIILQADPTFQTNLQSLNRIYLPGLGKGTNESTRGPTRKPSSGMVPLLSVAHIHTRYRQFPAATISFNLAPGHSLGEALTEINTVKKRLPCRTILP